MARHALSRIGALASIALLVAALFAYTAAPGQARLVAARTDGARLDAQRAHVASQLDLLTRDAGTLGALPETLVWPGNVAGEVERQLQARILAAGQAQGLRLDTLSPAPGPALATRETVGLVIEGATDWGRLMRFLDATLAISPAVGIGDFSIRTADRGQGEAGAGGPAAAPVIFRIQFWVIGPGTEAPT